MSALGEDMSGIGPTVRPVDQVGTSGATGERDTVAEACVEMAAANIALGEIIAALQQEQAQMKAELATARGRLRFAESQLASTSQDLSFCRDELATKAQQAISLERRVADCERRRGFGQPRHLGEGEAPLSEQAGLPERAGDPAEFSLADYLSAKARRVRVLRVVARKVGRFRS